MNSDRGSGSVLHNVSVSRTPANPQPEDRCFNRDTNVPQIMSQVEEIWDIQESQERKAELKMEDIRTAKNWTILFICGLTFKVDLVNLYSLHVYVGITNCNHKNKPCLMCFTVICSINWKQNSSKLWKWTVKFCQLPVIYPKVVVCSKIP